MTLTSPVISPCSWCRGSKFEPDPDLSSLACTLCDGGGLALMSGDLGPTRSCPDGRGFVFNPGLRTITVIRNRRAETYDLVEFKPDRFPDEKPSRAWEVIKHSSGEVYHVRIGGDFNQCDCRGFVSEATAKGDRRAWENNEPMYYSRGCVHLDFVATLLNDGYLDANRSEA